MYYIVKQVIDKSVRKRVLGYSTSSCPALNVISSLLFGNCLILDRQEIIDLQNKGIHMTTNL